MNLTNRPFWLCAGVTLLSALTSAGFSVAAVMGSSAEPVNALYGMSRSVSIALGVLIVIALRNPTGLLTLSLLMSLVQAGDALIGGLTHDLLKTVGPAFLALGTAVVGLIFWKRVGRPE